MRIAVVGGSGTVGRHVVTAAAAAGHEPSVITRTNGVDVTTGHGVSNALAGQDAIIDVSNLATTSRRKSVTFFRAASENLLAAARQAGVEHYVALSIVGIDRVGWGYYEGKRVQEDLVLNGPVPASVLRTTQFHEFAGQVLARTPGPVAAVPRMRIQPVAASEVAAALIALATGPTVGKAADLAGPEVHELHDLARRVLQAESRRRAVVPVRLPGAAGRAMAGGGLLPDGDGPRGQRTFSAWLAGPG